MRAPQRFAKSASDKFIFPIWISPKLILVPSLFLWKSLWSKEHAANFHRKYMHFYNQWHFAKRGKIRPHEILRLRHWRWCWWKYRNPINVLSQLCNTPPQHNLAPNRMKDLWKIWKYKRFRFQFISSKNQSKPLAARSQATDIGEDVSTAELTNYLSSLDRDTILSF